MSTHSSSFVVNTTICLPYSSLRGYLRSTLAVVCCLSLLGVSWPASTTPVTTLSFRCLESKSLMPRHTMFTTGSPRATMDSTLCFGTSSLEATGKHVVTGRRGWITSSREEANKMWVCCVAWNTCRSSRHSAMLHSVLSWWTLLSSNFPVAPCRFSLSLFLGQTVQ